MAILIALIGYSALNRRSLRNWVPCLHVIIVDFSPLKKIPITIKLIEAHLFHSFNLDKL